MRAEKAHRQPPSTITCSSLGTPTSSSPHRSPRARSSQSQAHLREAGQEGLDVDVGAEHLQVVVSQATRDPDCGHHPSLDKAKPKESLKLFSFLWRGTTKPPPSRAGGPHPAQLMPRTPPFCLPHRSVETSGRPPRSFCKPWLKQTRGSVSAGGQELPAPPLHARDTARCPQTGHRVPGTPQGPHKEGGWSWQPPGGQQGYQPFMFWSLYSIFFPSSLGWILRGNSRCVNSFPSSSGLRNACGTKQGAQPWCQELALSRVPPNHTGQPTRQPAGKWGGGNSGCSDPNASREQCHSLRATLLSYTQGEEQLGVATPTPSKDTSSPKTRPGCGEHVQSCHRAAPPQGPSLGATSPAPCRCQPQLHPTDPQPHGPQHALSQAAPAEPCASSPGASPSTACRHQGSG